MNIQKYAIVDRYTPVLYSAELDKESANVAYLNCPFRSRVKIVSMNEASAYHWPPHIARSERRRTISRG